MNFNKKIISIFCLISFTASLSSANPILRFLFKGSAKSTTVTTKKLTDSLELPPSSGGKSKGVLIFKKFPNLIVEYNKKTDTIKYSWKPKPDQKKLPYTVTVVSPKDYPNSISVFFNTNTPDAKVLAGDYRYFKPWISQFSFMRPFNKYLDSMKIGKHPTNGYKSDIDKDDFAIEFFNLTQKEKKKTLNHSLPGAIDFLFRSTL